jgi:RsiW-degrading membrane proteinase PrsW (M82 family)
MTEQDGDTGDRDAGERNDTAPEDDEEQDTRGFPSQTGVAPGPWPPRESETDPVKSELSDDKDLYDVATWESRSSLDSVAVFVAKALRTGGNAVLLSAAIVLFLAQVGVAGALVLEEPVLAGLTILSILPALGVAGYIWYGDPTSREPFVLLAATFLLSMLFASFAAITNTLVLPRFEAAGSIGLIAFYFLAVGPMEEFVKWLAIRVYAYRSDVFQTVIDGAVYGAVAGLGFAAIENFVYIVPVYFEPVPAGLASSAEYATVVASQRAFAGPGHVIFSAWAGFYLGLAKFNPENRGPIVVKGLLIAIFIHALYNSLVTLLPLTALGLFAFILGYHTFWFGLLYRRLSKYRALYREIGREDIVR